MDKLNITEGKWTIHIGPLMPDGKHVAYLGDRLEIRAPEKVGSHRANAQAIVTAVNSTYNQGIDPEAVPEMHGALLEANKVLSKMNYNPDAKEINRLHHGIKLALKKAGVQDV